MSRQEFCGSDHRDEFYRSHGDAALGRLQEAGKPKPASVPGLGAKPAGSILGLSQPPPPANPLPHSVQPEAAPLAAPVREAPLPAQEPPAGKSPANPRAATPPAGTPPVTSMALARTRQRPAAARNANPDAALNRLMEASPVQSPPVARAPMRFNTRMMAAQDEPETIPAPATQPLVPERETVERETLVREAAPPDSATAKAPRPIPAASPLAPHAATPEAQATAAPATGATPQAAAPEPEGETVMVERRGARPPASFVLTGQLAHGPRTPRQEQDVELEQVNGSQLALPVSKLDAGIGGMLKIDGARIPGTVDQVRPVAGDLMTILVVRATPSLLPGMMETPRVPAVEPHDWQAFAQWVRQRIREQDGPDPAWLAEMAGPGSRDCESHFVQALFGSDRFWPNPKTYIVYPTRELVRRPLLQHANLPVEQDTVPLLVSRAHEAAHRRVMAEWNPGETDAPAPHAGAMPPPVAPKPGGPAAGQSPSQPAGIQGPAPLPQANRFPAPSRVAAAPPDMASGPSMSPVLPASGAARGAGLGGSLARSGLTPDTGSLPGYVLGHQPGYEGGGIYATGSGFAGGIVLPRFGMRMVTAESRPLVVLHRQPPVARMVTLDVDAADRPAALAPAPPLAHDAMQPEIRQAPSGRAVGRLGVSLRLHSLMELEGNERDCGFPLRADEENMTLCGTGAPLPAVPSAAVRIRRAHVPVLRTAVRLSGADRAAELFFAPAPAEFVATVDQWSGL